METVLGVLIDLELNFENHISNIIRMFCATAQFKKREKHPCRSVTFTISNTPQWVLFTFVQMVPNHGAHQNVVK